MRTCFLHIGPHKTATTTLQACLLDNAERLTQDGLYVPEMGERGSRRPHHGFAKEIGGGGNVRFRELLAAELRRAGLPQRVVISSETFSLRIRTPVMRARIAAFFASLGYRVEIIAYIRPQITSINSMFTQRIKTFNLNQDFDAFFDNFLEASQFDHHWRFKPVLEDTKIASSFVPFSSAMLSRNICADFLARLGLSNQAIARYAFPAPMNTSPGAKTIAALLRVGAAVPQGAAGAERDRLRRAATRIRHLAGLLGWDAVRFNGLTESHKLRLQARFGRSNEEFARRAWQKSWAEDFAADEERARNQPVCRFDPALANAAERAEFDALCDYGLQLIAGARLPADEAEPAGQPPFR